VCYSVTANVSPAKQADDDEYLMFDEDISVKLPRNITSLLQAVKGRRFILGLLSLRHCSTSAKLLNCALCCKSTKLDMQVHFCQRNGDWEPLGNLSFSRSVECQRLFCADFQ